MSLILFLELDGQSAHPAAALKNEGVFGKAHVSFMLAASAGRSMMQSIDAVRANPDRPHWWLWLFLLYYSFSCFEFWLHRTAAYCVNAL